MHVLTIKNKNSTYRVVKKSFLVTMRRNELFGPWVCSKNPYYPVTMRRNEC